jgi:hypothetical protein
MYRQKPLLGELPDWTRFPKPIGLWLMNEGAGNTIQDLSGNGKDGDFTNAPTWQAGKYDHAIDFVKASDQYINIGSDLSVLKPQEVSVSVIVKADILSGIQGIYDTTAAGGNDGFVLSTNGAAFCFYIDDAGWHTAISATISTGIWYHVVGTFDGVTVKIYVDGILQTTTAAATKIDYGAVRHYIGRYLSASYDWDGLIDNVAVWPGALSASEIAQLYRNPFPWFVEDEVSHLYVPAGPPTVKPWWYYQQMQSVMRRTG